jgi:hypothetical protein
MSSFSHSSHRFCFNALDYNEWRSNFGNVQILGFGEQPPFGVGSGFAVPEAFSAASLVVASLAVVAMSRGRRGEPLTNGWPPAAA